MNLTAVIGYPISHSLSPKIHNFWFKKYNIAGNYKPLEAEPKHLAETIETISKMGFKGCNVTIPHKEKMLDILDEIDDTAHKIGAVNTVTFKECKTFGTNTDAYGFMTNIGNIKPNKSLVLGSGGASRAVCFGLMEAGSEVILTNRTKEKAEKLAGEFSIDKVIDWEEKENYLNDIDLLVNTTSLGMKGQGALEINLTDLSSGALVTDIVYNPLKTDLLKQAQERGNKTVDGLGMLLYQAQKAFEIWFGIKPEVDEELRRVVLS